MDSRPTPPSSKEMQLRKGCLVFLYVFCSITGWSPKGCVSKIGPSSYCSSSGRVQPPVVGINLDADAA